MTVGRVFGKEKGRPQVPTDGPLQYRGHCIPPTMFISTPVIPTSAMSLTKEANSILQHTRSEGDGSAIAPDTSIYIREAEGGRTKDVIG